MRIGLLDTGIDADLGATRFAHIDDLGNIDVDAPVTDASGHGSAVARLMTGHPDAPHIPTYPHQLIVARVLGRGHTLIRILVGLDWMLDQDVQVIALCAGLPVANPVFGPILARLKDAGVLVVCPVGNSGPTRSSPPGDDPSVLSVGATNRHGRCAGFSGSLHGYSATNTLAPDLLAPGVNVPTSPSDERSGTSMSAGLVAGAAAWLLSVVPDATPEDARRALCASASSDGTRQARTEAVFGRVHLEAAFRLLKARDAPPCPTHRPHDHAKQPDSPRLTLQLRREGQHAAIFVLSASATANVHDLVSRAATTTGLQPARVLPLPRARAVVVWAEAPLLYAIADAPDVWLASAPDANSLYDRLFAPWSLGPPMPTSTPSEVPT